MGTSALAVLLGSSLASAQVPTASFADDDESPPAASSTPAKSSSSSPNREAQPERSVESKNDTTEPTASESHVVPPNAATGGPSGLAAFEERTLGVASELRPGYARLNLVVAEKGTTVFVTARQNGSANLPLGSALAQCSTECNVDLPLGAYTVWVRAADETHSSKDFDLRSSRWLTVMPANQILRDFGFAAGAVGTVATVLGAAILAQGICKSCTETGRQITGGLALGLGLPMGAVGWSLYFIHREARIEDRILSQPDAGGPTPAPHSGASSGVLLQTRFSF